MTATVSPHQPAAQPTEAARQDWQTWHQERCATLRDPHGWLSLTGLEWLTDEPTRLERFPGTWHVDGLTVTANFDPADGVTRASADAETSPDSGDAEPDADDAAAAGAAQTPEPVPTVTISLEPGGSDVSLETPDGRRAEVASRLGQVCVRTRDPHSPVLAGFTETATYDYDADWVVSGSYAPYAEPQPVAVQTAQPGRTGALTAQGEAELLGTKVVITGDDSPALIFHDRTNGDTTARWRAAPAVIDGETITVDFNRSANFPAFFTPYGTCPQPPVGNQLDVAVEAGERA